jgi:hypothetical protein
MAKTRTEIATQSQAISRMRQRLDDWRKSNARGTAFPEKLWAAAGRLAAKHGVYVSSRALGLEYNKLKRASGGAVGPVRTRATRSSIAKPVKFIELTGALPVNPGGCRLSLQHLSGQRLTLEMAPGAAAEVVLQLCRSGWGAS